MDTVKEDIASFFINSRKSNRGRRIEHESLSNHPAFLFRDGIECGVFFDADVSKPVSERFENMRFYSSNKFLNHDMCLVLSSDKLEDEFQKEKFASICEEFVQPGIDGYRRKTIIQDPEKYWDDWSKLIGNRSKKNSPQSIIAELIVFDMLFRRGENPQWFGQEKGSIDIRGDDVDYEVKSSTTRYDYEVTISSDNQLFDEENELHLCYCIFEKSNKGVSINSMLKIMESHGMDMEKISWHIPDIGTKAMGMRYQLLKVYDYVVDDDFPKITQNELKGNMLPPGIKKISYTVDLSGVKNKKSIDPKELLG